MWEERVPNLSMMCMDEKNAKSSHIARVRVPGNEHPTFGPKHVVRLPARQDHAKQSSAHILG